MSISAPAAAPPLPAWGRGWLDAYRAEAGPGDLLADDVARGGIAWHHLFDGLATLAKGRLQRLEDRVARRAAEVAPAFRTAGAGGPAVPLSAVPLLIGEAEWEGIAAGVVQRAELFERLLADIYGPRALVADGRLPALAIAGSRRFLRPMAGIVPAGGHRLHIVGLDLARDTDGRWRTLAHHLGAPAGLGRALEARHAIGQVLGPLQARLDVRRHAPFLAAFRAGLAAACRRESPRIGLLTPGRHAAAHAEQAHLARALGFLLVEGDDLTMRAGRLFLRTIEGLKRVDAVWRGMDARWLDPLAFDPRSTVGVPGLLDALAGGETVVANMPGAGVLASAAVAALLPRLCEAVLGEPLLLPGPALRWGGEPGALDGLDAGPDGPLLRPAFADPVAGLPEAPARIAALDGAARAALVRAIALRPQDYVAEEPVARATAPLLAAGRLVPRAPTLRLFAARDGEGRWTVLPGAFARFEGQAGGEVAADLCVVAARPEPPAAPPQGPVAIRRNPGTLPSRAADNLFWLGRYLDRAEGTLRLVRATLGGALGADAGAGLTAATLDGLATLLIATGAAAGEEEEEEGGAIHDLAELAAAALDGPGLASLATLGRALRQIAEEVGDRLPAAMRRLLEQPLPGAPRADPALLLPRVAALEERFAALAGLAAEAMDRSTGWRFLDLGRRIERGLAACRAARAFAGEAATADDLATLLDLADGRGGYGARYLQGPALVPVRDLVALDRFNPRSLAFQAERIREHLMAMPRLHDDGIDEEPLLLANRLALTMATLTAEALSPATLLGIENRLAALSDAIGRRFFLQENEMVRGGAMVLA